MGLFVHEFFSSGASPDVPAESSLAREGLAMLSAVLADFAACDVGRPATTLDCRLKNDALERHFAPWPDIHWADIHWAESADHERILFQALAKRAAATFVIAPESDGILLSRRSVVESAGSRFLGHSAEAIALCADKLAFHDHLVQHGLPTICSQLFDPLAPESTFSFPIVVKPRDGAGSQDTFLIRDAYEFRALGPVLDSTFGRTNGRAIVQPFVGGAALSVAAIADSRSGRIEIFPPAEQRLSTDGRFHYLGGRIPAALPPSLDLKGLATQVCRSIPGLAGYIGFDLVLASDASELLLVEANPRLTTSYLGYRALAKENLAARILRPDRSSEPICWTANEIEFQPWAP